MIAKTVLVTQGSSVMKGKLNKSSGQTPELIRDSWRFKGDNNETSNKLNEFRTGKTTFKVLANAEVIDE